MDSIYRRVNGKHFKNWFTQPILIRFGPKLISQLIYVRFSWMKHDRPSDRYFSHRWDSNRENRTLLIQWIAHNVFSGQFISRIREKWTEMK